MEGQAVEPAVVQPIFAGHHDHIVGLAAQARLPVISDHRHFAEAGALLTYGLDDRIQMRRSPSCVDRILKGESPAEMPIEQSTKFYMGSCAAGVSKSPTRRPARISVLRHSGSGLTRRSRIPPPACLLCSRS